ncbi:tubulin/FtsZ family, GTPase domain protein (macronuclear) [Tetrahymena thermophila SB210]|uniref:Tubulin/FtsZ family, GTPase domain protein n=1 Tax=Tetrahymena thermophila (strain SB210) TaxID=312017 RepID=Q24HJ8_TETTS|nr:tubulin/FtsZ family, GTPase domain protein [Tetrahymena thermophila SB210]EAS07233.1 tubulin/FtsZ family, GTPase domain protein [Tetrahymena thermophila SB210]|eukprot:XP_001027475.1 tubulin/FtsZ family, GTPase domain protein [Tetrahymena thermophila SB210]
MSSIVSIAIGQCGISIQEKQWITLLQEYGIDECGIINKLENDKKLDSYFYEVKENVYKPRALFTDLDDHRINSLQSASLKQLFQGVPTVYSIDGSHNLFARGMYSVGSELKDEIQNQITYLLEQCDSVDSIQIQNSLYGGTGSGLGGLIYDILNEVAPQYITNNLVQYPDLSTQSQMTLEIYNNILGQNKQAHLTLILPFCNQNIQFLNDGSYKIQKQKGFDNINNVISQIHPLITSGSRYHGSINASTRKICTNIIPFPRLKHMSMICLPLNYYKQKQQTQLDYIEMIHDSVNQEYSFFSKDTFRILCSHHMIRGVDIHQEEIESEYNKLYRSNNIFATNWIPNSCSISYCNVPCQYNSKLIFSIISNYNICRHFEKYTQQYSQLFRRKAYLHYYLQEGMDEMEFTEAESNINDVICDYQASGYYENVVEEDNHDDDDQYMLNYFD